MPRGVPTVIEPGDRFGKLTVVDANLKKAVAVRCDCGATKTIRGYNLTNGNTTSCGCVHKAELAARNFRHGLSFDNYQYRTWGAIKQRCYNPRDKGFRLYGARGIRMHGPWISDYPAFVAYLDGVLGPRPEGRSLDRIDNDGHYEPGNLRWATPSQQTLNSRRWKRDVL
jgi:hypothetical protein